MTENSCENSGINVIIIGAGASGISAATRLISNNSGEINVKILEAETRIGGRIHSVFLGDGYVDLGAEEVHGETGNIVFDLASDFLKKKKPLYESKCYYSDGTRIEQNLEEDVMKFLENFQNSTHNVQCSIGEVFRKNYSETIMKKYGKNADNFEKCDDFLELLESFFQILEGPFSWNEVVTETASHYKDCEGDQFLGWKSCGCKKILEILMETCGKLNIFFNKKVVKITIENLNENPSGNQVKLECGNGEIYKCDFVIFTPSVGVLREKYSQFFGSSFPEAKIDVLEKIGYGNVMKVAMKFNRKWWNRDNLPIGFVWSKRNNYVRASSENDWICSIRWLIEAPENDRVLVAWITGSATTEIEKFRDERIQKGVVQTIKKFLGNHFEIEEPEEVLVWYSNSNFRGTYSYETVEASEGISGKSFQEILSEPLCNLDGVPKVLFAGEATHSTQYSTVNGAILSGFREADRILEKMQKV